MTRADEIIQTITKIKRALHKKVHFKNLNGNICHVELIDQFFKCFNPDSPNIYHLDNTKDLRDWIGFVMDENNAIVIQRPGYMTKNKRFDNEKNK